MDVWLKAYTELRTCIEKVDLYQTACTHWLEEYLERWSLGICNEHWTAPASTTQLNNTHYPIGFIVTPTNRLNEEMLSKIFYYSTMYMLIGCHCCYLLWLCRSQNDCSVHRTQVLFVLPNWLLFLCKMLPK